MSGVSVFQAVLTKKTAPNVSELINTFAIVSKKNILIAKNAYGERWVRRLISTGYSTLSDIT